LVHAPLIIVGFVMIVVAAAVVRWWRGVATSLRRGTEWMGSWRDSAAWGTDDDPRGIGVTLIGVVAAVWFVLGFLFVVTGVGDSL
jgi:hypothetical protein